MFHLFINIDWMRVVCLCCTRRRPSQRLWRTRNCGQSIPQLVTEISSAFSLFLIHFGSLI